jgi:hypothetical protein
MGHPRRRSGIWDLAWAPMVTLAVWAALIGLHRAGPNIIFVLITGLAATVVEVVWWLSQVRREHRRTGSSGVDLP